MRPAAAPRLAPEIRSAFAKCRAAFLFTALFSIAVNVLALAGPLYMLQIYDRVLTSHSSETLVVITVLVTALYAFYGLFDFLRSRVMARIGAKIDLALNGKTFDLWISQGLLSPVAAPSQPLEDLQTLRQFFFGPSAIVFLDLPWVPIYVAIIFAFHPWLGFLATAGVVVAVVLAISNEVRTRRALAGAARDQSKSSIFAAAAHRNAEAVVALGMRRSTYDRWNRSHIAALNSLFYAGDAGGAISSASRAFRLLLQSLALAVGALLVIAQAATPGVMLACSLILGRALAPIDQAIAQWRTVIRARQASARLSALMAAARPDEVTILLPAPRGLLEVDGVHATPPGGTRPALSDVRFSLRPGQVMGVVGPSGAGKSSLARLLVGVWIPVRGTVRLDGATLDQRADLGDHVGYLPQDVELFEGTVAENICRFRENATDAQIVAAAQTASAHEMIIRLSNGYNTSIGDRGNALSAGQRQRIGLARALYGDPILIVLDEPNSNLDAEGDAALSAAIMALKERNRTVVVVSHRSSALTPADVVLSLRDGRQVAFGPKEQVLRQPLRIGQSSAPAPV